MANEGNLPLKDSGNRQEFETGAVRDLSENKGAYDLLQMHALREMAIVAGHIQIQPWLEGFNFTWLFNYALDNYIWEPLKQQGDTGNYLHKATWGLACAIEALKNETELDIVTDTSVFYTAISRNKSRFDLLPAHAIFRVARVLEKGALKYSERNWEKGIPTSRFYQSGFRHLFNFIQGDREEDHLGQSLWNMMCLIETRNWIDLELLPKDLETMPPPRQYYGQTVETP